MSINIQMVLLVQADSLSLREFQLDHVSQYLATSHVWSEGLFLPTMVHNMTQSLGFCVQSHVVAYVDSHLLIKK